MSDVKTRALSRVHELWLRYASTSHDRARLLCELVFLVICLLGIFTSIRMNAVGRSLWVDEAMLASSFSKRSVFGILWGGEFEYLQSAPFGWILLEKITAKLCGNTESVLRTWSIVFYVLSLVVLFFLSKRIGYSRPSFFGAAILANTPLVLEYSNMFKPYISDCLVALLICCLFALWLSGTIRTWLIAVLLAVLLWCSQPACFVEGGFVLAVLLHSLVHRDRNKAASALIMGIVICVSFAVYYLFWVKRMTDVSAMREWWEGQYLSAIFASPHVLGTLRDMITARFLAFGNIGMVVMVAFIYGAIRGLQRQDVVVTGAFLGLLVACIASLLEMYPMADRLWVFSLPLMLVVALYGIGDLSKAFGEDAHPALGVAALCLVLSCTGISTYRNPAKVYKANQEMNIELAHLNRLMMPNDPVYVVLQARPSFEYANGYGKRSFGEGGKENVVFGSANYRINSGRRWDDLVFSPQATPGEDVERIRNLGETWIVCSHIPLAESHQLVDPLLREGHLELTSYSYSTPLYHWCKNGSECLARATMEEQARDASAGTATIKVVNNGDVYLGTPFEELYLKDSDTGRMFRIGAMMAPGAEVSVVIEREGSRASTFELVTQTGTICGDARITIGG